MYSLIWSAAYAISTLSSTILYTVYCRYMYIYIERTGRVPRFHSEDVKTRRREQPPAASQRRHREDASSSPSGVAASQRCEVAKTRGDRRGSVAASQRRDTAKTRAAPSAASQSRSPSVAYSKVKTRMPCLLSC